MGGLIHQSFAWRILELLTSFCPTLAKCMLYASNVTVVIFFLQCLVYFKVEVQLRKRQLYGQNCIPLISLKPGIVNTHTRMHTHTHTHTHTQRALFPAAWEWSFKKQNRVVTLLGRMFQHLLKFSVNPSVFLSVCPGIKFIPLRTSGGDLIPESGLFVRIKKGEETIRRLSFPLRHQASVEEDDDFVDLGEDVDVMEFISPSLMLRGQTKKEQSVSSSAQSSRPMSSPPILSEDEPKFELLQKLTQKQTVSVPPEQSPRTSNQATSLSS